jgi:anion-transporting  ArsA/GET3 family ATPase
MTQFLDIYWSFGFYLFFFFLIVLIKELIQFVKSSNKITRNFARAYYFLGLSYIFAAIASDQLIVVNDLLLIVLFVFGWMGLQLLSQEKKVKYDDSVDEESDVEITSYNQLLATRKKEFARITDLLRKNNYDEPFALLLNGNWGVGKTSLINVLTKKLEDEGNFKVFIQPLILDTTEKQMDYFFGQLEEMLNSNGIYTGKDSPFKKYVNILFQTINTLNMKQVISLDGLLDSLNNDEQIDFRSSKIRLENDIQNLLISKKLERKLNKQSLADKEEENLISSETKKKIYIIIDDFDRVEEETFKNTLVFIKELVNFKGVNVIFLMDEQKIEKNEKINRDYLDKFVNRKFQLSTIGYEEIISHFNKNLVSNEIKNEWIKDIGNEIKESMILYIEKLTEDFEEKVEEIQQNIENLSSKNNSSGENTDGVAESDRYEKLNTEIKELKKTYQILKDGISNVRRIKKIIREIKELLIEMDQSSSKNDNFKINVEKIDRLEELIVRVAIFKILYGEQLDKIIQQVDFFSVVTDIKLLKNKDHLLSTFFISFADISFIEEKGLKMDIMSDFCNSLMHNRSFEELFVNKKTVSETILSELDNKAAELNIQGMEEIKEYLKVIMLNSYGEDNNLVQARIVKLIDHIFTLYQEQSFPLVCLFELLGKPQRNPLLENEIFLEGLIEVLRTNPEFQNSKDKNVCIHYVEEITIHIFLRHQNDILMLMRLLNLKVPTYRYENFKSDLGDIYSLKEMVAAIKRIFNEENKSISDLDFFKMWFENSIRVIESENRENIYILESVKHYQKRVKDFMKLYRIKEELLMRLKNTSVDPISKFSEKLSINSSEELTCVIEELYEFICICYNPITSPLLRSYSSILVSLERYTRSIDFNDDIINKAEELYKSIPVDEYDEFSDEKQTWLFCTVKLGEVKENFKQKQIRLEEQNKEDL